MRLGEDMERNVLCGFGSSVLGSVLWFWSLSGSGSSSSRFHCEQLEATLVHKSHHGWFSYHYQRPTSLCTLLWTGVARLCSRATHPGDTAGAEMEPSSRATVATGLGVMCMLAVAAELSVAEDQGVVAPRHCLLSHYRSLDPRALAAVKALRDSYGQETLSWWPRNCSGRAARDRPRPSVRRARRGGRRGRRGPRSPLWPSQSCAWLRRVARRIANARDVLSSLRSRERFPGAGPTLELLEAAGRDVAACVSDGRARDCAPGRERDTRDSHAGAARCGAAVGRGTAAPGSCLTARPSQLQPARPGSRRRSPRPARRPPERRRADSPRCHEASAIFHLLRLLTRDLRLAATSGRCV
ncbi:interferon lambda-4-like [Cavia porcellus]|uniref:interferon lambda-4-like n=1 Tax=Cavia porcellus TaxID=10141 RepID=UPI002FE35AC0